MLKRFHVIMIGKVQGVFFRASACEQANVLGISGFVRNLPDGSVEIEAEGDDCDLNRFLQWCRHGPPGARVEDVSVHWKQATHAESGFNVRYV